MKTIYLTGQNNFGNRGCEALVRSTVATLRSQLGDTRFFVPSLDIPRDSAQWPEAVASGVRFVPAPQVPASYRWWGRACRLLPFLKTRQWPSLRGLPNLEEYLQEADAVISIGGDNYSLDYGPVSLFFFVGIAERALALGKKTALWGASVGPFSREPGIEALMAKHLSGFHLLSIRESHSVKYLAGLGITSNVVAVVDSAFVLGHEKVDCDSFWPSLSPAGVLGINVSPLIEGVYARSGKPGSIKEVVTSFISRILSETELSVLLIPHVAPLDGAVFNNDERYLQEIFQLVPNSDGRLGIVPAGMNACQLKEVIAHCRYFIGARTHATIAALSNMVPTVSIAYSIKARGINLDLFGHENYVLPTPETDENTLMAYFMKLVSDEKSIRETLNTKIPEWKSKGHISAEFFVKELTAKVS
jgi:polysaccharide pyruvyl transferase WcaK-like protein